MFLRVILVRHGQSANNALVEGEGGWAAYYARRSPDAPLTALGERQAARAGALLARMAREMPVPLVDVYCSAMSRALHTASIMSAAATATEATAASAAAAAATAPAGSAAGTAGGTAGGVSVAAPVPRPRVWVDVCEVGGLFDRRADADVRDTSDRAWRGVPGLTRAEIGAKFPLVDLGREDKPPVPPASGTDAAATGGGGGGGPFSAQTSGAATDRGWWLSARKESELEGAARTCRVFLALRQRARDMLAREMLRRVRAAAKPGGAAGGAAAPERPAGVGVTPSGGPEAPPHEGEALAIVCHGDFITVFLRCATGGLSLATIAEQERAIRAAGPEPSSPAHAHVPAHAQDSADAVDLPLEQSLQFSSGNCSFSVVDFIPADDSV